MGLFSDVFDVATFGAFSNDSGGLFGRGGTQTSPSTPWGPQATALQGLYGQAGQGASQAQAFGAANFPGLFNTALQGYNQLGQLGQVGNPFVQQQIGQLGQQYGETLQNEFLPALGSYFGNAGQGRGNARERAFAAEGARGYGQDFLRASTNLLADSSRQAIGANALLPGFGQSLQQMPINAFLGPYASLAGILGTGPSILGQGSTTQNPGLGYAGLSGFLGGGI